MKRLHYLLFFSILACVFPFVGCNDEKKHKYDIEDVFSNDTFNSIMEGEVVPVEIKYGIGGVAGYHQFSTKDSDMINAYIKAFRALKIKQVITNEEDMTFIFDGIEDYSFIMEDGTTVVVGTNLSTYVLDRERNIQFVLGHNDKLHELNRKIRQH